MYCKNCGAEIAENVKFCPKCGTPQAASLSEQAPAAPTPTEPTPVNQTQVNQTANVENTVSGAQEYVEEGKSIISKLFSKNPFSIFDCNKDNALFISIGLYVIHILLFAFVICNNFTHIANFFVSLIQSKSGYGSLISIGLPVNYSLFLPLCGIACILLIAEFVEVYLFAIFYKQKPKSAVSVINVVGLAHIPMIMGLILSFVVGFVFPPVIIPVLVISMIVHTMFLHRGIKSLVVTDKELIWQFCILLLITGIIVGIVWVISCNSIIDFMMENAGGFSKLF